MSKVARVKSHTTKKKLHIIHIKISIYSILEKKDSGQVLAFWHLKKSTNAK